MDQKGTTEGEGKGGRKGKGEPTEIDMSRDLLRSDTIGKGYGSIVREATREHVAKVVGANPQK